MANNTLYPFGPGGQTPTGIDIVNDLVTGGADKALSAEQGKLLNQRIFYHDVVFWENSSSTAWLDGNIYNGAIETSYHNRYIIITNFPTGVTKIKITRSTPPDSTYTLNYYGSSNGTSFTSLGNFGKTSGVKTVTLGSYDRIAFLLYDKPTTARARQEGITITYEAESEVVNECDVVDNLSSTSATDPLSANQGRVLDGKITDLIGGEQYYTLSWNTGNIDSDGSINTSYANKYTDAIRLEQSTFTIHNPSSYNIKLAYYNSSLGFVSMASGTSSNQNKDYTAPDGAAYIRLCAWDKPSVEAIAGVGVSYIPSDTLFSLRQSIDQISGNSVYTNPVLSSNMADPCVVDGGNGYFYVYFTGGLGTISMRRTPNFMDWETADSPYTAQGISDCLADLGVSSATMWAPEIVKVGDKYNLYVSKQATPMVVFQSDHPYFGYEYAGKIITTTNGLTSDNIDACVRYDLDGTLWMFWGSTYGMYRQKLTANGLALDTNDTKAHVAGKLVSQDSSRATVFEGAYLYRRKGYWYLFVSAGLYSNYTYCLKVGRATSLSGTFVDKDGNNMTDGYATTILSSASGDALYGPGHNGQIITDRNNRTYMIFHSHYTGAASSSYRYLCLQEVFWDDNGWPYFGNSGKPQLAGNTKPSF